MTIAHKNNTLEKVVPYVLMIAAVIGIIASFILTYDKIQYLMDPNYEPGCNINPVLSCGSIMSTEQSSLLGVPNTIFGLIGFSMLFVFGLLLAGGASFLAVGSGKRYYQRPQLRLYCLHRASVRGVGSSLPPLRTSICAASAFCCASFSARDIAVAEFLLTPIP